MATLIDTSHTIIYGQRNSAETYLGALYVVKDAGIELKMYKSTDRGLNWAEVDAAHRPSTTDNSEPCIAAGRYNAGSAIQQTLHINWERGLGAIVGSQGLNYVTFDTTNDLWGTPSCVVNLAAAGSTFRMVNNACDSDGNVHVAWSQLTTQRGGSASVLRYANSISGWTNVNVSQVAANHSFRGNIMIDDAGIPHITYQTFAISLPASADVRYAIGNTQNATSFTLTTGLGTAVVDSRMCLINDKFTSLSGGDLWLFYLSSGNGGQVLATRFHSDGVSSAWSSSVKAVGNSIADFSASKNGAYIYVVSVDTSGIVYVSWTIGNGGTLAGVASVWAANKYQLHELDGLISFLNFINGQLIVNVLHYWGTNFNFDGPVVLNILFGTNVGGGTQDVYYTPFYVHNQIPI